MIAILGIVIMFVNLWFGVYGSNVHLVVGIALGVALSFWGAVRLEAMLDEY